MIRRAAPRIAMAAALAVVLPACDFGVPDIAAGDIPDRPVWTDVKPLLDDHCNLCHGRPANYGAPHGFRLDRYADDAATGVRGARSMARKWWGEIQDDAMPPAAAWGDGMGRNGKKLIEKWMAAGRPECYAAGDCEAAGASCTAEHLCR